MRPYPDELIQSIRWSLQNEIVPELSGDWTRNVANSIDRLLTILEVRWQKEAEYLIQDTREMRELFQTLLRAFGKEPLREDVNLAGLGREIQATLGRVYRQQEEYPSVPVLTSENGAFREALVHVIEGMEDVAKKAPPFNGALEELRHQIRLVLRRQTDRDSELAQATFARPAPPPQAQVQTKP